MRSRACMWAAREDCQRWLAERGWGDGPWCWCRPVTNARSSAVAGSAPATQYWPPQLWGVLARGARGPAGARVPTGAPVEHAVIESIAAPRTPRAFTTRHRHDGAATAALECADSMTVDTVRRMPPALDCPLTVMFANADQRWWRPRSRLGAWPCWAEAPGRAAARHPRLAGA
jgi:hypothetical protein